MTKSSHAVKTNHQQAKPQVAAPVEETPSQDTLVATQFMTSTSDQPQVQREALERLPAKQQQSVVRQYSQRMGNKATQTLVSRQTASNVSISHDSRAAAGRTVLQRSTLREDSGGNWPAALLMIKSTSDEIFAQQIRAVADFCSAARGATPPFEDTVMQGLIETVLGAAFGGIGTIMKAAAVRAMTRTMVRAELAALNTALNEGEVTTAMTAATEGIVDRIVGAGKSNVTSAVTAAAASSGAAGGERLDRFRSTQENALITLRGNQERTITGQLGALASTPDVHDEWLVANAVYEGMMRAKDAAHSIQYNKLTDSWFLQQVQTIGGGVRPGILRIYLRDRYPNAGASFSISGANLSGEGSADAIREQLGKRALKDIEIPKWITMNGSMGRGIIDCMFHLSVNGGERVQSAGPVISAARPLAQALVAGNQQVQGYGGNRWGPTWLAAHHLSLADMDNDDARNTSENQSEGVRKVWDAIKDLTPGTIGNSSWS